MRWEYKEPKPKKPKSSKRQAEIKQRMSGWRVKTRFAFFPVTTTLPCKEVLWLEFYQTNDRREQKIFSTTEWCWVTHQIAAMGYWSK